MKKIRTFLRIGFFILFINIVYASPEYFDCSFRQGPCDLGYENILFGNYDYSDANGEVLSSNVAINYDKNYNKSLCCRVTNPDLENVKYNIQALGDTCNGEEILYFTDSTNSRVAVPTDNVERTTPENLNLSNYKYKLCVELPDSFSKMSLLASDDDGYKEYAGYQCLFKISSLKNGVVSSCDATFNGGDQYDYTIWTKLWENKESLRCDNRCTSVLDGRVYSDCGSKITSCEQVPTVCDGSLYGSWVKINPSTEIKCESPWNQKRSTLITNEQIRVQASSEDKCQNLFVKDYPVIVNDVLVNMKIYICND